MKDRKEEHDMHRDKRRQINHKFNFINLRTILIVLLLFLTNLIVLTLYRKIDKNSESLLYKFLAKNKHRFGGRTRSSDSESFQDSIEKFLTYKLYQFLLKYSFPPLVCLSFLASFAPQVESYGDKQKRVSYVQTRSTVNMHKS